MTRDTERWVCAPRARGHMWVCLAPPEKEGRTATRIPASWYPDGTVARLWPETVVFRVRRGRFVSRSAREEAVEPPPEERYLGCVLEIVPWAGECPA